MKKTREKKYFILAALVIFGAGIIIGSGISSRQAIELDAERTADMILPAVDSNGNGVAGVLFTTVKPGSGRILLDTSKILNYLDTQLSGRNAAIAASNYAKANFSSIDIIYTIKVNASLIEGPSAGASMALSVLLALDNKTSDGVAITGTITPDGSIGRVGAILEKAKAARASGVRLLLVPTGQSVTEQTMREKTCNTGPLEICKIAYGTRSVNIGMEAGIEVREVATLEEPYSYFIAMKAG